MTKNTSWTDELILALELANERASLLPAGQYLEAANLNKVLDAFDHAKATFMLQCELQGFKLQTPFTRFDNN